MTNSEAIKELKHQVYKNTDNCEMKISKDCYKAIINSLEENDKLKAEIEQYKSALTTWNNANNEMLKFNQELKDEVKQLKSELEQSIRLPLTNADKIRSMSDEELADFITSQRKSKCNDGICVGSEYCYYNNDNECSCNSSIFEWLKARY